MSNDEYSAFVDYVDQAWERAVDRLVTRPEDGLVWAFYKKTVRRVALFIDRVLFVAVVRRLNELSTRVAIALFGAPVGVEIRYQVATDLCKLLFTATDLAVYVGNWWLAKSGSAALSSVGACGCAAWAVMRIIQTFTVIASVSLDPRYECEAVARPVWNTFWHYIVIVVSFGVLYVSAWHFDSKAFICHPDVGGVADHAFLTMYFSFVTIATVGYGDIVPGNVVVQGLAGAEMMLGMFIILIILQRVFAANRPRATGDDSETA